MVIQKEFFWLGSELRYIHFFFYILVNQFLFDIVWLYGALQQSLPRKGSTIVKSYECSQDGVLVWKKFLATYRHGGNVAVYLNQQQSLLQKEYYLQYPGGMFQFVEDFETAFTNIDAVCEGNPEMSQCNVGLYTNQGKRELFISKFSAGPVTMDMIEAMKSTTTTWPDMVDALRQRIARHIVLNNKWPLSMHTLSKKRIIQTTIHQLVGMLLIVCREGRHQNRLC